jgi:hypothetical protein
VFRARDQEQQMAAGDQLQEHGRLQFGGFIKPKISSAGGSPSASRYRDRRSG